MDIDYVKRIDSSYKKEQEFHRAVASNEPFEISTMLRSRETLMLVNVLPTTFMDRHQFFRCLANNFTVMSLYLIQCTLNDPEFLGLVNALTQNRTITKIGMWSNTFGTHHYYYLVSILDVNNAISELEIISDQFTNYAAKKLSEILSTNRSLTNVRIVSKSVDKILLEEIQQKCKRNRKYNCTDEVFF